LRFGRLVVRFLAVFEFRKLAEGGAVTLGAPSHRPIVSELRFEFDDTTIAPLLQHVDANCTASYRSSPVMSTDPREIQTTSDVALSAPPPVGVESPAT
jgi:hypothetical protein